MASTILNIARNAMRPKWGAEMLRKVWLRWNERDRSGERAKSIAWCREQQVNASKWAEAIDSELWKAAQAFASDQRKLAAEELAAIGVPMGGGGFYGLLFFLTRLLKPDTIVETGVAAGFSSRAFLLALRQNGSGHLYSSDFPYFRLPDPERFIGCIVEDDLRDRWTIMKDGDRKNLPAIASSVDQVGLFHYDSDKSYSGREFALDALSENLSEHSVIMFDDIQDNLHFKNMVEVDNAKFLVFEFEGKWIGLKGGPARLYGRAPLG